MCASRFSFSIIVRSITLTSALKNQSDPASLLVLTYFPQRLYDTEYFLAQQQHDEHASHQQLRQSGRDLHLLGETV